jgi:hypothetical protein
MKPADFYIGYRHVFGYFVAGVFWLSGLLLALGIYPGAMSGWFEVAAFFLLSYILGYSTHGFLFKLLSKLDDRRFYGWRDKKLPRHEDLKKCVILLMDTRRSTHMAAEALTAYTESMNEGELEQFCKAIVLERGSRLADNVMELEGTINFIGALIPSLIGFGLGTFVFLSIHKNPPQHKIGLFIFSACVVLSAVMFFFKFHPKREHERRLWLEDFVILEFLSERIEPRPKAGITK